VRAQGHGQGGGRAGGRAGGRRQGAHLETLAPDLLTLAPLRVMLRPERTMVSMSPRGLLGLAMGLALGLALLLVMDSGDLGGRGGEERRWVQAADQSTGSPYRRCSSLLLRRQRQPVPITGRRTGTRSRLPT
jgi:hypothetical protein